jgi:acyl-CoA thioesterase-1
MRSLTQLIELSVTRRLIVTTLALLAFTILSSNVQAKTILVFGDSLSAGYGLAEGEGWVDLLRANLNSNNKKIRVINASISGETSGGGLARLPATLSKIKPDIVIIELGANDGLRGFPINTFKNNLANIMAISRQAKAEILLLGMHIPPNYGKRYTDMFFQTYQTLAKEQDVPLVPFFLEGVATNPDLMQSDGLHPNAKAQPFILNNVLPYLQSILDSQS